MTEARATTGAAHDPVIVYGPLRGGSTMLRLMLDSHPALSMPGETDFLIDYLQGPPGALRYDLDGLREDRIFRLTGLRVPDGADPAEGDALLAAFLRQMAPEGARPTLMMHHGLLRCHDLMPDAPVIRLMRDPRDVARSAIGMGWAGDVWHGLHEWLRTEEDWHAFRAAAPEAPVHEVRYEDLVAEPERHLRAICDVLGLPYDPAMLTYPERTTYDLPDPKLSYQWKRKLSEREVRLVEARAGDMMDRCGYPRSGLEPLRMRPAERAALKARNRAFVWNRLVRRYGVARPLLRGLGRRLGIGALERAMTRSMDQTLNANLK